MTMASGVVAAMAAYAIFALAVLVVIYLLMALGIRKVLLIYGYSNTWMAWIPCANLWALADAASEGAESWKLPLFRWDCPMLIFKLAWLIVWALGYVPAVGGIVSLFGMILLYGCIFQHVYSRVENRSMDEVAAVAYISGVIQIVAWIKFIMYPAGLRLAPNNAFDSYGNPSGGAGSSYGSDGQGAGPQGSGETYAKASVYSTPSFDSDPFNDAPAESPFEEPTIVDAEIVEHPEQQ